MGLLTCAVPVFLKLPGTGSDFGGRTQGLVVNRRLLLASSVRIRVGHIALKQQGRFRTHPEVRRFERAAHGGSG